MTRPIPTCMLFDSTEDDRGLTDVEAELVGQLTAEERDAIDAALLRKTGHTWRKVAALVGDALSAMKDRLPLVPDVFYGERVRQLVETGVLESQGDLARMRSSEVRLAGRGSIESGT